ncbi:MAG: hypothetical protein ACPG7F_00815 [Aggregatilineales bacterium]
MTPIASDVLHTRNGSYLLTLYRDALVYQYGDLHNGRFMTIPTLRACHVTLTGRAHPAMLFHDGRWNMRTLRMVLPLNLVDAYMHEPGMLVRKVAGY